MTEAKKDLEPVPRSVLKYDTDADSELEEGDEKGMRWERVALVFFFFFAHFAMSKERVHPCATDNKCTA